MLPVQSVTCPVFPSLSLSLIFPLQTQSSQLPGQWTADTSGRTEPAHWDLPPRHRNILIFYGASNVILVLSCKGFLYSLVLHELFRCSTSYQSVKAIGKVEGISLSGINYNLYFPHQHPASSNIRLFSQVRLKYNKAQ